ncbi:MAG: DegT/DnrJ/EryC1/StrS family aminotransferase [Chloroflexota bacterium]|nr:DegT/DnrJ/EryC1/StrS family aminotransferase [Chloroflexota bacterium]
MIRLAIPEIGDEEIAAVEEVLRSGWLIQGQNVKVFEDTVAGYVGTHHAISVNSGTSALYLALISLGVSKGDEVITSALSFPATANTIELVGAKPVFVDIEMDTYNLDVNLIENNISARTRAIMPVHLFGQMADMKPIVEIAEHYGLGIIEDAAPALGATYEVNGIHRKAGSFGDIGCFSFHPRKVITTGEGGMITTNDDHLALKLRRLRNHGMETNGTTTDFVLAGFNNRMTEIQAAIGIVQMRKIDQMVAQRQHLAEVYEGLFKGIPWVHIPQTFRKSNHTYQAYVVVIEESMLREHLINGLRLAGIETTLGAYAVHATEYYKQKYCYADNDFPNASLVFTQSIALPLYPSMSEASVKFVVDSMKMVEQYAR